MNSIFKIGSERSLDENDFVTGFKRELCLKQTRIKKKQSVKEIKTCLKTLEKQHEVDLGIKDAIIIVFTIALRSMMMMTMMMMITLLSHKNSNFWLDFTCKQTRQHNARVKKADHNVLPICSFSIGDFYIFHVISVNETNMFQNFVTFCLIEGCP